MAWPWAAMSGERMSDASLSPATPRCHCTGANPAGSTSPGVGSCYTIRWNGKIDSLSDPVGDRALGADSVCQCERKRCAVVGDLRWRRELVGHCRRVVEAWRHAAGGGDRDESWFGLPSRPFVDEEWFRLPRRRRRRNRCAVRRFLGWQRWLSFRRAAAWWKAVARVVPEEEDEFASKLQFGPCEFWKFSEWFFKAKKMKKYF